MEERVWSDKNKTAFLEHVLNMVVAASHFSSAETGKRVRVDGKKGGAKYRAILEENLLQKTSD